MTNKTKTCTKCGEIKPLDEFYNNKGGKANKYSQCKKCKRDINKKYNREHKEKKAKESKEWYERTGRQKGGHLSMYENKLCAQYLGIVIAERLCRHLFKDVEIMPMHNPEFDIICNKGKKIDVKSASVTLSNGKYPHWQFHIDLNKIPDFFILIAFDNRTDLNPLHLWMIPGNILNHLSGIAIPPSTIHKWNKWKRDIKDAQLCCNEIKAEQRGN